MTTAIETTELRQLRNDIRNIVAEFKARRLELYDDRYRPQNGDLEATLELERQLHREARNKLRRIELRIKELRTEAEQELEALEESPLAMLETATLEEVRTKAGLYAEDLEHDYGRTIRAARTALRTGMKREQLAYLRALRSYAAKPERRVSAEHGELIKRLEDAVMPQRHRETRETVAARLAEMDVVDTAGGTAVYSISPSGALAYDRSFEASVREQADRPEGGYGRKSGDPTHIRP